jgi:hypothetical protein
MRRVRFARAVTLLTILLLCSAALGQSLVEVKPHDPAADDRENGTRYGRARPRIDDVAVGRAGGGLPGMKRVTNGPAGIPELDEGRNRDPSSAGSPTPASRPPEPGVHLVRHEVDVQVIDGVAVTEIDQVFHNEFDRQMEGTYVCELPDGSVIDGFSIFMNGQEVRGTVMASATGRALYREIVRGKKDPGIVELIPGDRPVIRTRIFPIPARGDFRVKTRYTHVMDRERGTYLARVGLKELGAEARPPLRQMRLGVAARATWPLQSVTTLGYDFEGLGGAERRVWSGKFQAADFRPESDLTIRCIPRRSEPALALYLHTDPRGERFFMAVVSAGERPLEGAALTFDRLEALDVYPAAIPVLQPGRQALVFGRLAGTRSPVARLVAREGEEAVELETGVGMGRPTGAATRFVAAMWAVRRVEHLLSGVGAPSTVTVREVEALGARYGILTPHTVFLAR